MRTIWTGSRHWEGFKAEERVKRIFAAVYDLTEALGQELTVVHGGCETGLDKIVDTVARRWKGLRLEVYKAQWERHGKKAGPIRNQLMVDYGADMCLGFPRGISTGTRHCMSLARNAKIFTICTEWDPEWTTPPVDLDRYRIEQGMHYGSTVKS